MSKKFPHLSNNESTFPDVSGVDVYKYDNDFDYSRFDAPQMRITVCNVPWDMGEAHVGNRTISGIGNVVHFGTPEKRNEWFSKIPDSKCFRYETEYKNLHRENAINVDIPFDVASKYNYVAVDYNLFANDDSPVINENENGLRWWGWFIREVEMLAPNTTRLHLMNDAWQTFVYGLNIGSMILERGHAPMFATGATDYLSDPINNSKYLLAPDANYGEANIVASSHEHVFNASNMFALIITTADVFGNWNYKTPAAHFIVQGAPAYYAFAVPAPQLSEFLNNCERYASHFVQTIQAIAFVSSDMVTIGGAFWFAGTTCYRVSGDYKQTTVHHIRKDDFGYPLEYRDIAKLYTYPYSYIEVSDGRGDVLQVRIETTNGRLDFAFQTNLVFPWLNLNAHLISTGKQRKTIRFQDATTHNMPIGGNWYEIALKFDIPTFGVVQDAEVNNDYATHFIRAQMGVAAENARANANAAADTALANVNATQAGLIANNADAITNANTKIDDLLDGGSISQIGGSGGYLSSTYAANLDKLSDDLDADRSLMAQQTSLQSGMIASTGLMNAAGSIGGGIMNGALTGGMVAGVPGAVAGGAANGIAQAVSSGMAISISITNNQALTDVQEAHAMAKFRSARDNMMALVDAQKTYNAGVKNADNAYMTSTTNRFSGANGINNANAGRENATSKANATRDYNTAASAIDNQANQAKLNAPLEFGNFANGSDAVSKPLAIFSNVVTQSDYAIAAAGDDFLRFGYALGRQWRFDGDWNVGKYFTYWKLIDFTVKDLSIPDLYMDKLRFFLFGGVTVWRNPDDIGHKTIYENLYPDKPETPDEGETTPTPTPTPTPAPTPDESEETVTPEEYNELKLKVDKIIELLDGAHTGADGSTVNMSLKDRVDFIDTRTKESDRVLSNVKHYDEYDGIM